MYRNTISDSLAIAERFIDKYGIETEVMRSTVRCILSRKLYGVYAFHDKVNHFKSKVMRFITNDKLYTLEYEIGRKLVDFLEDNNMEIITENQAVELLNKYFSKMPAIIKKRYSHMSTHTTKMINNAMESLSLFDYNLIDEDLSEIRDDIKGKFIVRYSAVIIEKQEDISDMYLRDFARDEKFVSLINNTQYTDRYNNIVRDCFLIRNGRKYTMEPFYMSMKLKACTLA